MEYHRVKTVNTDKRSRKRLKFASSREKSKYATADVYRSYKRKLGTTSSTTTQREEAVHHNTSKLKHDSKRRKIRSTATSDGQKSSSDGRTAVVRSSSKKKKKDDSISSYDAIDDEVDDTTDDYLTSSSSFSDELDITIDRNGSEIFTMFHRKIWGLVRSLPEILHHSTQIIDLLLMYMLSPSHSPNTPSLSLYGNENEDENENVPHEQVVVRDGLVVQEESRLITQPENMYPASPFYSSSSDNED